MTLANLARSYGLRGDAERERRDLEAPLDVIRAVGDRRWEANILNKSPRCRRLLEAGPARMRKVRGRLVDRPGNRRLAGRERVLLGLARVAAADGDLSAARERRSGKTSQPESSRVVVRDAARPVQRLHRRPNATAST